MGRPTNPQVVMMRGRRISDEKIREARELRENGFSVRAIDRKLGISKRAAHRLTRGISWEDDSVQLEEAQRVSQRVLDKESELN